MKTYIKKDVIQKVYEIAQPEIYEISKVAILVNATFEALRKMMSEDGKELRIEIRNFGVFEVKKMKAKPKARNPKTGELFYVPARRKTHFKPGKMLKEELKKRVD